VFVKAAEEAKIGLMKKASDVEAEAAHIVEVIEGFGLVTDDNESAEKTDESGTVPQSEVSEQSSEQSSEAVERQ